MRFLSIGFDPQSATEEVPIMPKARYDIMRAYMPTVGTLGLDMMLRSTTIQVRGMLQHLAVILYWRQAQSRGSGHAD